MVVRGLPKFRPSPEMQISACGFLQNSASLDEMLIVSSTTREMPKVFFFFPICFLNSYGGTHFLGLDPRLAALAASEARAAATWMGQ